MHQVVRTAEGAGLDQQWDSVESDTESLAHERVHLQQLQMCTGRHENRFTSGEENTDSLQPGEDNTDSLHPGEGAADEDQGIYDSLDIAAHPYAKSNSTLLQTEYLDVQTDEKEEKGTTPSTNKHTGSEKTLFIGWLVAMVMKDPRKGKNMQRKLDSMLKRKRDEAEEKSFELHSSCKNRLLLSPLISRQLLTDDDLSDLRYDPNWRTNLRGAGSFRGSLQMSVEEYHPEEKTRAAHGDKQGLVIKGGYRYVVDSSPAVVVSPQMTGSESDQPYRLHPQDGQTSSVTSPQCPSHTLQLRSPEANHSKPQRMFTEEDRSLLRRSREGCENNAELNELTSGMHAMHIREYNQQEVRHTQDQQRTKVYSRKLKRLTEDIVQRNKTTLGRNASKCSSYVSMHALKQETPVKKVHATLKEKSSPDPKLETQQLRVTQISKGKEAQWKETSNPPALGVKAERGDRLSSTSVRPAAVTWSSPQKTASSQPVLPTIQLNINLNTSSHLLPLIQQRSQGDFSSLTSPASEVQPAFSPGCQPTDPENPPQMCQKGVNAHPHHQNMENSIKQWQRTAAFKTPLSCELWDQMSPNEVHTKKFPPNLPRTPTSTLSLGSGSYSVVPPIGKSMTGKGVERSPAVNSDYQVHRSSSDGYLVQMERQKQLRTRVTYKAYSLKDYKQLKSDINLGGLGADFTATEKTKIKRQKLYSNVIRAQNKKISRIPFLLAKDPDGNDKKVPRMKALDYARTIVKPPVASQPKQRQKRLDDSQPTNLDILRKRHEEEKQAVAFFRRLHAV